MKPISEHIFRAYDIRGEAGKDFDADWAFVLGRAAGAFFREKGHAVCVTARDCRLSSPELEAALSRGLAAAGLDVLRLGLAPTPQFYHAVSPASAGFLGRACGVVVTASHNPPKDNGFKLWEGRATIPPQDIQRILALFKALVDAPGTSPPGLINDHDNTERYVEDLAKRLTERLTGRLDDSQGRPQGNLGSLKVVVDGGNGAAGPHLCALLTRLGAEVVPLYAEPDGRFPNHHPDPLVPANLADLQAKVLETGADLGLALDGDGDRVGVVDEAGAVMPGDLMLAVFARDILARRSGRPPKATFVIDVKCSELLPADIEAHGGRCVFGRTGHSFMKYAVWEHQAAMTGELSGHFFFQDGYAGFDDGVYAGARFAAIAAWARHEKGIPVSALLADWPESHATPEIALPCPDAHKFAVVAKAAKEFAELGRVIDVDGVRIQFPEDPSLPDGGGGWGLVRASNTTPKLVTRYEARTRERMLAIRHTMETRLQSWIDRLP